MLLKVIVTRWFIGFEENDITHLYPFNTLNILNVYFGYTKELRCTDRATICK